MTQNLIGRWKGGWALDLHTVSSKINPDGSYDNVRSKIGEALYLLKYRNDNSQIDFLVNELVEFLKTRMVLKYIDVILYQYLLHFKETHNLSMLFVTKLVNNLI